MSDVDPPRLLDPASGAPEDLRALFDASQRHLPTPAELERLASKLGSLLGPTGGEPTPSGGSGSGLAKLAAVTGALIGGAVLVSSLTDEVPRETREAPPATPQVEPATVPEPVATHAPPRETAASPEATPTNVADEPSVVPRAPERRASAELEVQVLERARRALAENPSRALALTTEHKLRFPGGVLAQEREVIAIEALRRLGRAEQARLRSEEFSKNYPGSAHRYKLDAGPGK